MHGAGQRAQARWDVCSCHFLIPAKFCYLGFSCYIRERMAAGMEVGGVGDSKCAFYPSTEEAETEGSQVRGQPGPHREALSQMR